MKAIGLLLGAVAGLFIAVIGAWLAREGWTLVNLGGSWYYLLAGAALVFSGILLALRRPLGGLVFGVTLLATLVWAVWEAHLSFWSLMPRVVAPVVIGILVLLVLRGANRERRGAATVTTATGVVLGLALMTVAVVLQYSVGIAKAAGSDPDPAAAIARAPAGDWRFWGRDAAGTRFGPYAEINRDNVDKLEVAWTFRTGRPATGGSEDQSTPMQIGDTLYVCTPTNVVIAVDADTGAERWRHDPNVKPGFWNRCRGLGYYEPQAAKLAAAPAATPVAVRPEAPCARRIISTTIDARIFELDAATGALCPGFGDKGVADLKPGMGEFRPSFYFPTSAPTVVRGLIVIGGWVQDNTELNEPSGVVRAFSADTGELVWAWDLGNPAITRLPPPGQTYTRGTPNVWSTPAFDEALGLIYLPTGNATPDYWGSHRSDAADKYNSSVVALDIATGRERWRYQTVHHDVWDWDIPSQPMLVDLPTASGPKAALVQLTKRGQIFVLDRATGAPLVDTVERPVPQNPAPGEWLSPTQPYSVGMPTVGAEQITERLMWGLTPIDQVRCRIAFRSVRYDGDFTPPGLKPSLQSPGNGGGMNWGSGSYDAVGGRLIVNVMRIPQTVQLIPSTRPNVSLDLVPGRSEKARNAVSYIAKNTRFESDFRLPWQKKPQTAPGRAAAPATSETMARAPAAPAAARTPAPQPIGIPCLAPPQGEMAAIDLGTRQIVWKVPTGTAERSGPWGLYSHLNIPVGTPSPAGSMTTAGGLVFHAATTDPYIRAYDTRTGKVVWKARMPVGAGANPMTYVSPKTGRQYVVISAGGARSMPERGDYVIAYALPKGG